MERTKERTKEKSFPGERGNQPSKKFWKGEPEGKNLFQEVFPSEIL